VKKKGAANSAGTAAASPQSTAGTGSAAAAGMATGTAVGPGPGTPAPANKGERPFVYVDVVFEEGLLFVEVKNYSNSRPAFNVQTTFSPSLTGVEGTKVISDLHLFKNISFLAPRRSIRTFLDRSNSFFLRGEPTKYIVTVSYRDRFNASYVAVVNLDLMIFMDIGYLDSSWQTGTEQNDGLDIVHY